MHEPPAIGEADGVDVTPFRFVVLTWSNSLVVDLEECVSLEHRAVLDAERDRLGQRIIEQADEEIDREPELLP